MRDQIPTDIGPYRLSRPLGGGGHGLVFLAEQREPVRRPVAIRIMHAAASGRSQRRFQSEQRILARMNHHHIAQVYEVGTLADGRPYTVLEYVAGQPLDSYCDQRRLGLRRRLELFLDVCRGVQHAHERGIMHLDLKPSNILVAEEGGRAVPKIIDFCLAREGGQESLAETAPGRASSRLNSLAYLSPEQIAGSAGLDIRADVYALGVILYQLLSGRLPHGPDGHLYSFLERVANEDAAPMAAAFGKPEPVAETAWNPGPIAACRGLSSARLRRILRGELECLAARALVRHPEGRYQSAGALGDDVDRWLEGRPLRAHPASHAYLLRKWMGRHRLAAIAAPALLAILLLGLLGTGLGLVQANRSRAKAERAGQTARSDSRKAQAVASFIGEMLAAGPGEDAKLMDAMQRMSNEVEHRFAEFPELRADVHLTIGRTYNALGFYTDARTHVEKALAIRERMFGDEHELTLNTRSALVESMALWGNLDEAEALARKLLAVSQRSLPPGHSINLDTIFNLGILLEDLGRLDEAESQLLAAEADYRRYRGPDHPETAIVLMSRARIRRLKSDTDTAAALLRKALAILETAPDEYAPITLVALYELAMLYRETGHPDQAEALQRRELKMGIALLGDEHPDVLTSRQGLARTLFLKGDLDAAEALYRSSLAQRLATQGPGFLFVCSHMNELAALLLARGKTAEAEDYARQAIALGRRHYQEDHPTLADFKLTLARCHLRAGRLQSAEPILLECQLVFSRAYGPHHRTTRIALAEIADLYERLGRSEEAAGLRARLAAAEDGGPHPEALP